MNINFKKMALSLLVALSFTIYSAEQDSDDEQSFHSLQDFLNAKQNEKCNKITFEDDRKQINIFRNNLRSRQ